MMRCLSCNEAVDETRALGLADATIERLLAPGGLLDFASYVRPVRFHVRYVTYVLPQSQETSDLHTGPLICGPLEAWT